MLKKFLSISLLSIYILVSSSSYGQVTYSHTIEGYISKGSLNEISSSLNKSQLGDKVQIIIHSPGGLVLEMMDLMKSMITSNAIILCYVPNYAYSAAALIFQACNVRLIEDDAELLYHFFGSDGVRLVPRYMDIYSPMDQSAYKIALSLFKVLGVRDLLTNEEYYYLNQGDDIILTGVEYKSRGGHLTTQ